MTYERGRNILVSRHTYCLSVYRGSAFRARGKTNADISKDQRLRYVPGIDKFFRDFF